MPEFLLMALKRCEISYFSSIIFIFNGFEQINRLTDQIRQVHDINIKDLIFKPYHGW